MAVAHPQEKLFIHFFQTELEFEMLVFVWGRKTGQPGEKPSQQGENQRQTQPTYDAGSSIQPGSHWCEASALTTLPSLPLANSRVLF